MQGAVYGFTSAATNRSRADKPGSETWFVCAPARRHSHLHQTGSLLYLPFQKGTYAQNGIDVYDVRHGDLRERILLSENLANRVNGLPVLMMAVDETGKRIFLITDTGLTIVKLNSVPLSIGSVTPNIGPAAGGAQFAVRGSGFQSGTEVTIGGVAAITTFVDQDTLQVIAPPLSTGPAAITVNGPDGATYTLDAAYTAQ